MRCFGTYLNDRTCDLCHSVDAMTWAQCRQEKEGNVDGGNKRKYFYYNALKKGKIAHFESGPWVAGDISDVINHWINKGYIVMSVFEITVAEAMKIDENNKRLKHE